MYLLAHPGIEINTAKVANEIGVERRVIEENLPRLVMTDLILRVQKFTHKGSFPICKAPKGLNTLTQGNALG